MWTYAGQYSLQTSHEMFGPLSIRISTDKFLSNVEAVREENMAGNWMRKEANPFHQYTTLLLLKPSVRSSQTVCDVNSITNEDSFLVSMSTLL